MVNIQEILAAKSALNNPDIPMTDTEILKALQVIAYGEKDVGMLRIISERLKSLEKWGE